jgi:hypothetical protein
MKLGSDPRWKPVPLIKRLGDPGRWASGWLTARKGRQLEGASEEEGGPTGPHCAAAIADKQECCPLRRCGNM